MFRWLSKLLDGICAVAGALVLLQAPLFMHQYMQQLSGHTEELHIQVKAMEEAAKHSNKTIEQYIQKFVSSGDVDFTRQGDFMMALTTRSQDFTETLLALQMSTVFTRPFVFISHLNWDIVKSTWYNYTFGFPISIEGFVYAFIGMLIGYMIYYFLQVLIRKIWYSLKSFSRSIAIDDMP